VTLPVEPPAITTVIVSHDSRDDLVELVPALLDPMVQVVIVDNASRDGTADAVAEAVAATGAEAAVDLVRLPVNVGWARGCNIGAGRALAPVVAFVNPDARPTPVMLRALSARLGDDAVGAVAPRFLGVDGRPQAFYFRFLGVLAGMLAFFTAGQRLDRLLGSPVLRRWTYDDGAQLPRDVDQPGAACLVMNTEFFRRLGGFDDDLFLFFADTDLCRRIRRAGRDVTVAWDVDVVHAGGGSVNHLPDTVVRRHVQRDYLTYVSRWHGVAAQLVTRLGVALLTGLIPALTRVLRGRPRAAATQLRLAVEVLR
jgi:GT2 family glycosyltransferase